MMRTIVSLLVIVTVLGAFGAYHTAALSQSDQYQQCTQQARSDPQQAQTMAEQWVRTENTPSAHHCLAISLFALKRYGEAAESLENLGVRVTEKNLSLWISIQRQAARAWELHQDMPRALAAITKAITVTAERGLSHPATGRMAADMLVERSRMSVSTNHDLQAFQDLDQALSLAPGHEAALLLRAELSLKREAWDMAKADLEQVLNTQPDHPQAKAFLTKVNAQ